MSMTKAEKAAVQEIKDALEEALMWAALHKTEAVKKDVPPAECFKPLSVGYDYAGSRGDYQVEPCCSSASGHSFGSTTKTDSQKSRHLYSTRLLALKAARNAIERDAAAALRNIDKQIEAEMQRGEQ